MAMVTEDMADTAAMVTVDTAVTVDMADMAMTITITT